LDVLQLEELRSNELIGIQPTEVNKLFNLNVNGFPDKHVIRQPVTFKDKTMYNVHRLLRAISFPLTSTYKSFGLLAR
jgi:DNA polymerase-3 subunit alpha